MDDEAFAPVSGATVTVQLSDDATLRSKSTTDAEGMAIFFNVPTRTLILTAIDANGNVGTGSSVGGSTQTIALFGLNNPSPVNNNDFALGTLEGWVASPSASNPLHPTPKARRRGDCKMTLI